MNQPISRTVEIPKHYFFQMAVKDYRHWQKALWREFFQNSIDAGATEIKIASNMKGNSVIISDNGCGMSLEILQDKLLCLGGSHKAHGSVGAFGKAKELLFFSWPYYRIKTDGLVVDGEYNEYTIRDSGDSRVGTRCTIMFSDDALQQTTMQQLIAHGRDVAALMETPCQIIIDGELVETVWNRGALVRDMGWCQIFHNKDIYEAHLQVRINGIWMFDRYIGHDIGAVTVELTKNSLECLTSNRDGLQDRYQTELDQFIKRLVADTQQALKPEKQIIRRMYRGSGVVNIVDIDHARETLRKGFDRLPSLGAGLMDTSLSTLAEFMKDALDLKDFASELTTNRFAQIGTLAKNSEYAEGWAYDYRERMAFIGYAPDFVTKFESKDDARVTKFMKTRKADILAKMWTEIVKEVMLTSGYLAVFTAGFTFETDTEAQVEQQDGQYFFYLNPDLVLNGTPYQSSVFKKRRILVEDLKDKAIHEISHIRYQYHDEGFVGQMAKIRLTTHDSFFAYQTIQKIR